jgi:hypothetical protein
MNVKLVTWNARTGACDLCGYSPRMGNRRTPQSRANWLRYLRQKHEDKHMRDQEGELEGALSRALGEQVSIVECSWRRP